MAERNEFGVVYNQDYNAWYIVYRLKDTEEFKIDTKIDVRPDEHGNDCITDTFLDRIKYVATLGYTFNPYVHMSWLNDVNWF